MVKETLIKTYEEIAKEIKDEFGEEISIAEINSVVNSQFKIMLYGFNKGIGTHIPHIGKFICFDMDFFAEKVILPNKELQADLIEAGKQEEATKEFKISYAKYKEAIKDKTKEQTTTAHELINTPNIDNSTDTLDIFKNLR